MDKNYTVWLESGDSMFDPHRKAGVRFTAFGLPGRVTFDADGSTFTLNYMCLYDGAPIGFAITRKWVDFDQLLEPLEAQLLVSDVRLFVSTFGMWRQKSPDAISEQSEQLTRTLPCAILQSIQWAGFDGDDDEVLRS